MGEMVGWHHCLNAHSGRQWRTGEPGVLQSVRSWSVGHLATEQQQNVSLLSCSITYFSLSFCSNKATKILQSFASVSIGYTPMSGTKGSNHVRLTWQQLPSHRLPELALI